MKKLIIIIDPQNDFIDGTLGIEGAQEAIQKINEFVNTHPEYDILVSQDSHHRYNISLAEFWFNGKNKPAPFTKISLPLTFKPIDARNFDVVNHAIRNSDDGSITIWPDHCIINTTGWEIESNLKRTLANIPNKVSYIKKGLNPLYEQNGMFMYYNNAPNVELIAKISSYDSIIVGGLAKTHCVKDSLLELLKWGSKSIISKTILVDEFTVSIPGIDVSKAYDFIQENGLKII